MIHLQTMKNLFLKKIHKKNNFRFKNFGVISWSIFHGAIFLALGILFLCGRRFFVNTNLFDILPESSSMKSVGDADRALSAKTGRQFFILSQSENFEDAKFGAEKLCNKLNFFSAEFDAQNKNALFENISLGTSQKDLDEIFDFFYRNRFLLLDKNFIAKINSSDGKNEIAEAALEKAYGGFSITPMEYISGDPFFLTENALENFIASVSDSGTSMTLRDGVLCAECEEKFFVMIRGTLTNLGASITNRKSGVKKIYECAQEIQSQIPQIEFIFSGVPFHSYKSSSGAQNEIAIISTLSMLAIILLFIFIFKNALPIFCSVTAIALCALTALCATLLIFGQIHILCFVFGTTLIGTCLDYSVHFFVRWKGETDLPNGIAIRKKLLKGFLLSFASTEICYLVLLFAPFALLKQIAIFSFTGILSSFLTVILLYPKIPPLPKNKIGFDFEEFAIVKNIADFYRKHLSQIFIASHGKKIIATIFIAILVFIAIFYRKNLRIENNLRNFYKISGKLLDDEILSAKVLNHGSSGWYFIVRGKNQNELFANEEKFCEKLNAQIASWNLSSFAACSKFIPSILSQMESWRACDTLLESADEQLALLGFDNDFEREEILSQIFSDYENAQKNLIQIESEKNALPPYLRQSLSSLYIGEIDGEYFSAILPLHANDAEIFKELCAQDENVFFVEKMNDIENELNRLTKIMLALLGAAFVILIFVLQFFYPAKTVLKIVTIPLVIILTECATFAAFNIPIGFFSVTGIILVFGLGLDYIIYTVESGEKLNALAVFISFVTTELSFGAIALSSFAPVHIFGTAVFAGLFAALFGAMFCRQQLA